MCRNGSTVGCRPYSLECRAVSSEPGCLVPLLRYAAHIDGRLEARGQSGEVVLNLLLPLAGLQCHRGLLLFLIHSLALVAPAPASEDLLDGLVGEQLRHTLRRVRDAARLIGIP